MLMSNQMIIGEVTCLMRWYHWTSLLQVNRRIYK